MPKPRVEKILSDDGVTKTVQVEVGERGVTKFAQYTVPSTPSEWQKIVASLTDTPQAEGEESPLAQAYRLYVTSVDRAARAKIYESLAQESTFITVGKDKKDIMEFPTAKLIVAINGMRSQRMLRLMTVPDDAPTPVREEAEKTVDRGIGFGPWRTAAKKLVEGYEDSDGNTVKPQARENAATGMLEPLA